MDSDFQYNQKTGQFFHGTHLIGTGHAGNGDGLNNPDKQEVHGVGPLPRGFYTIQPETSSNQLGIVSMRLDPNQVNRMFDRFGFYIHAPIFSEGCIVQELNVRCGIAELVRRGKNQLEVI